jgi:hypothetical protein
MSVCICVYVCVSASACVCGLDCVCTCGREMCACVCVSELKGGQVRGRLKKRREFVRRACSDLSKQPGSVHWLLGLYSPELQFWDLLRHILKLTNTTTTWFHTLLVTVTAREDGFSQHRNQGVLGLLSFTSHKHRMYSGVLECARELRVLGLTSLR